MMHPVLKQMLAAKLHGLMPQAQGLQMPGAPGMIPPGVPAPGSGMPSPMDPAKESLKVVLKKRLGKLKKGVDSSTDEAQQEPDLQDKY